MKIRITKSLIFIASIYLLLCSAGCRSSKSAYTGDVKTSENAEASVSYLYDQLCNSYKPWSDIYVPVNFTLESPKEVSISGRATMVYGKEINISLRVLGMEVGIIYINQDAIWVVDKFHKYYFTEKYAEFIKGYDLTINDLQDLLLGRAVIPGKGIIKAEDAEMFSFLSSDDSWIMTPKQGISGAEWHYTATKSDPPLLSTLSLRIKRAGAIECRFKEATNTPAGIADGVTSLIIPYHNKDMKVSLTWSLNDAKWNEGRSIKFSEPTSYKRIDMESIIKAVDQM